MAEMSNITMGDPELNRLRDAAAEARKGYEEAVAEKLRPIVDDLFDGAEFKVGVQANSDMRKPWVRIVLVKAPFAGRSVEIKAYDFLEDRYNTARDAFDAMNRELHNVGALSHRSPWPPGSVIDEIERHAVMAVMRDLELRIRKMPDRTWLLDLKRTIDAAIVKDVQEG